MYTDTIEEFGGEGNRTVDPTEGAWTFYKKAKKLGLKNDQILILIERFYLGRSFRQILDQYGWTSMDTLYRRYQKALALLKKRGFKG